MDIEKIKKDDIEALFVLVQDGKIPKNSMRDALIMIMTGKDVLQIKKSLATMSETELREIISSIIKEKADEKDSVLMRIIMAKTKGRASGALVARLLREMK